MKKVSVSTPASTANLGAGFDCLGLALNLRNVVELWDTGRGSGLEIDVEGEGEDLLPTDDSNLVYRAAERVFARLGKRPSGLLRLHAVNGIPLGSGMGSSALGVGGADSAVWTSSEMPALTDSSAGSLALASNSKSPFVQWSALTTASSPCLPSL